MKERRGEEQGEPLGRTVSLEPGSQPGAWFWACDQPGWSWHGLEPSSRLTGRAGALGAGFVPMAAAGDVRGQPKRRWRLRCRVPLAAFPGAPQACGGLGCPRMRFPGCPGMRFPGCPGMRFPGCPGQREVAGSRFRDCRRKVSGNIALYLLRLQKANKPCPAAKGQ